MSQIIYCFRTAAEWDVSEECPDAFESIMEIFENKLSDKSIIEKLKVFEDNPSICYSLSSDFKSSLLEAINEMDEEDKEDIYGLDEIVENLEN